MSLSKIVGVKTIHEKEGTRRNMCLLVTTGLILNSTFLRCVEDARRFLARFVAEHETIPIPCGLFLLLTRERRPNRPENIFALLQNL